MTVIVGLVEDGEVWMGADRRGMWGEKGVMYATAWPKIEFRQSKLIGLMGNGAVIDAMLTWDWSAIDPEKVVETWRAAIPSVLGWLDRFRISDRNDAGGGELKAGFGGLLGVAGRLYVIDSGLSISIIDREYEAVGAGDELAMGALYALSKTEFAMDEVVKARAARENLHIGPETRLLIAMRAAAAHRGDCGGPFDVFRESMSRPVLDGVR